MSALKKHKTSIEWEEGSENVFADLDMLDAEEKLAKARLALKINEIITKKKLKQAQAAKLLGVGQPQISLISCGHLKDFSVERLTHFLILLNQDVDIVIRKSKGQGKLRVVYA